MPNDANEAPLSLMDIANIDISEIAAKRFELLPQMVANFEVTKCVLEMSGGKTPVPIIIVDNTVLECLAVEGEDQDKEKYNGKIQKQSFRITEVDDLGRFRAYCEDAGVEFTKGTQVTVNELVAGIVTLQFPGKISHRADRNDPKIVYASVMPTPPSQRGQ